MANYLYNGVELPDINTVWTDKTTLPYALISDRSTLEPTLVLTSLPLTTAVSGWTGNYVTTEGECLYMRYILENGAWTILNVLQTLDGSSESHEDIVWSNYDIPNTDGSVYLAASDPVDPNAPTAFVYDKASFLAGLAAGLCGRGVGVMPEPIAYLYNGIQLPVPPEWDKETYPYATMQLDGSTGNYFLWLTSTRPCKSIIHLAINPSGVGVVYATKASEGHTTWYQADKWDEGESPFGALTSAMWANYDIFKTDGITVYLESSEPIPVYE